MHILATIIIGLIVGLVARFLLPGKDSAGLISTIIIGVVGAFLGSTIGQLLGFYLPGEPAGFIMSVIGAMIFLVIARKLLKK